MSKKDIPFMILGFLFVTLVFSIGVWDGYNKGYNKGIDRALDTVVVMMEKQVKDTSVVSAVEIQTEKDTVFYILSNKTIK